MGYNYLEMLDYLFTNRPPALRSRREPATVRAAECSGIEFRTGFPFHFQNVVHSPQISVERSISAYFPDHSVVSAIDKQYLHGVRYVATCKRVFGHLGTPVFSVYIPRNLRVNHHVGR
eukprot:286556_1